MTGRLPFNPRSTAAASSAQRDQEQIGLARGDQPISVSALSTLVGGALTEGLPKTIRVVGEVSGFRDRTHWYFDLKDNESVVSCVVFASSARKLSFRIEDGQAVVLTGRVDYYSKSGKLSFIATRVEPVGAGALDMEYRRLVAELRALGWFDDERKRRIPSFPRRVAIVTSRSGAALQDVLDTMRRRAPWVGVLIADARVQGDGAAAEVAARIAQINRERERLGVDVIVVTRGGGSMQDLWAFNDPDLARIIVESQLPVVAAIGHETDITIAELVADLRSAAPTQAAVAVTPDVSALREQVDRQAGRLGRLMRRIIAEQMRTLAGLSERRCLRDPRSWLRDTGAQLNQSSQRLRAAMRTDRMARVSRVDRASIRLGRLKPADRAARIQAQRSARLARQVARLASAERAIVVRAGLRLNAFAREIEAVAPMAVLRRGYSVTLDEKGRVIQSVTDAPEGATIETRLADGSVRSVVGGQADRSRAPKASRGRSRSGQADDPAQSELFGDIEDGRGKDGV